MNDVRSQVREILGQARTIRQLLSGEPKPGYVADLDDLPGWQQETDADIFDAIERAAAATG